MSEKNARGPCARSAFRAGASAGAARVLVGVCALFGCGEPAQSPELCSGKSTSAIYGAGDASVEGVSLSRARQAAVGALELQSGRFLCSATFIASGWALGARHCDDDGEDLWFATDIDGTTVRARAVRRFAHEEADVLLLALAPEPALELEPLEMAEATIDADWVGRRVTLAGLGLNEAGETGVRRFTEEPIVEVNETSIVVDGAGQSGACAGDSGGPLLVLEGGEPRVAGVLRKGATSCVGLDRYTRIDSVRAWIDAVRAEQAADPCSGLTAEGTCHDGIPVYCDGGLPAGERCTGKNFCGFSHEEGGYRCVEEDPCQGAGPDGVCADDQVMRCEHGVLVREPCAPCGICTVDAAGKAVCQ